MKKQRGNPEIDKYHFLSHGDEPLTSHLQIRLSFSQMQALKARPDWQNWLRQIIASALSQDS
jgi:hypothetical protein